MAGNTVTMDTDNSPSPSSPSASSTYSLSPEFQEVKNLIWGNNIKDDNFRRWSQGFVFSQDEPTALVQWEGGPCAVIAPVQGFIVKGILSTASQSELQEQHWRNVLNNTDINNSETSSNAADQYLVSALTEILCQAATAHMYTAPENTLNSEAVSAAVANAQSKLAKIQQAQITSSAGEPSSQTTPPSNLNITTASINTGEPKKPNQYCLVFLQEPLSSRISLSSSNSIDGTIPPDPSIISKSPPTPSILESVTNMNKKLQRSEQEIFHRNLRILRLETRSQVEAILGEKIDVFKGYYGVLQFLYSVILTKTVALLHSEMSEDSELIDSTYGNGSQSLINLMLTGRGVNHVWDNEQDVGGLKLQGIIQSVDVGFLTVLERFRFCEVGSFYKNPKYPVWVVSSEYHLTVLFSTNMDLVCPETPGEVAKRVFRTFDPEGNNFISTPLLEDVMSALGLFCDSEYVDLMKKRLDPEQLGIVLQNDFMQEFYSNERFTRPDTFVLYHYNGLHIPTSNRNVTYHKGNAILLETDIRSVPENTNILTCLQTKWPSLDVEWSNGYTPSLD